MKKLIYTEENFITPEECQELIKLSNNSYNSNNNLNNSRIKQASMER